MNKKSIEDLGFLQVLKKIQDCALSQDGVGHLASLGFLAEQEALLDRQAKVAAFVSLLGRSDLPSPSHFADIGQAMATLENPLLSLDGPLLVALASYIQSGEMFLHYCNQGQESLEPIQGLLGCEIEPKLLHLVQSIHSILDEGGQVKESHPAIRSLRKQVEQAKGERSRFTSDFIRTNSAVVQSDQGAFRDGRLVIPVRNDRRTEVPGFISSSSSSGSTVFMEPFRLVEMNNAVVMAENQILIEIAKLLSLLDGQARACKWELQTLRQKVGQADALFACAKYSFDHHAIKVDIASDTCSLIEARHPLLGKKAVPITVMLDEKVRSVVISGPNAGGKTVTIKTVGLMTLMNQFCGFIPAKEGSSLPLFDEVFTDIGDEQSIEEELSTFSGHMKQVGYILRNMTSRSLVIMDELGSGTDPVEGAALARATLEYCLKMAKLTLVTSHHGVLKQFAYAKESVINASMEFDEDTHLPTFRVINGIPGDSHALDTAKAMHLPVEVLEKAQQYLGSEAVQIGEIIKGLERRKREADAHEEKLRQRHYHLQQQVKQVELKELKLRQDELILKQEQSSELSRFMREKRRELEHLVAELRSGEITREKTLQVKGFVNSLQEKQELVEAQIESELQVLPLSHASSIEFHPNMDVLCTSARREGRIIRKAAKGKWVVAVGTMKFTLPESELSLPNKTDKKVQVLYQSSSPPPKMTLDVRGLTLEEALSALDIQIESALVHGFTTFSIIHGYGDGILSRGIGEYLKNHQRVTDYRFALPEDGGMGKTYVFF
ncbi:endonuclease MutS2 [Sphaerochaeta sp. PS]|uniref:endonuclease MutS2 n=1 Tax=Sphaerochaeta sp. PS TaxID=3076336 RepID=UPI0028A51D71|nr:Smr/MutS family protein [Sphaerochaeta sp. PS]MDT4761557.1 Smr/MutS family protein [Sphaerochaeta sp. PS]